MAFGGGGFGGGPFGAAPFGVAPFGVLPFGVPPFGGGAPLSPSSMPNDVIDDHGFEVQEYHSVTNDHGFEVGLFSYVISDHGFEVDLYRVVVNDHGFEVGAGSAVVSDHGIRIEFGINHDPGPGTGADRPTPPMDLTSWQASIRQTTEDELALLFKRFTAKVTLVSPAASNSWDLTPYLLAYRITQRRNEPCDWEITLADSDFRFVPWGGDLAPYIKGANIDATYHVRNYLTIEIHDDVAGTTWESPHLIQTHKRWNFAGDVPAVTLTGTDYSKLLLGDNLSMADFVSAPGAIVTAKQIIRAILVNYGIGYNSLDFTDYAVPRFPPKGSTPLDWVKSLLWVRQAEWFWDRDVFRAHDRYSSGGVTIRDIYHMENVGFDESVDNLRNEFIIKKTAAVSEILGQFEYFSPDVPGFVPSADGISFTQARRARIVLEDIVSGTVDNVVWWNDYGPLTTMPSLGEYPGPIPTNKVVMTYTPSIPFPGGVKAHIKGFIVGEALSTDYYPPGVAKAFTVTVKDTANQDDYGVLRENTPQDATYVPDVATAEELGAALIDEAKRTINLCTWAGVLFPSLTPGMSATIYATVAGATGKPYYVESVTKQGTPTEHMMSVETSHFA